MELMYISILTGICVLLICGIIEDFILGDRGRTNQITNYFKYLKGEEINKRNLKFKYKNNINVMSNKSYLLYAIPICIAIFIVIRLSMKSTGMAFIMSFLGFFYPKAMRNKQVRKTKETLNLQLKDALNSIVVSLKAGMSLNSALIKCTEDLEKLYSLLKQKPMLEEFKKIKNDLNMGVPVEEVLKDFMKRMQMEDVDDFVNSVLIVRQKGGNLIEVMANVNQMISDKITMKREISLLTTGKKFEARIMSIIPIFIIIILPIISPTYMEPLYSSFVGKVLIGLGLVFLVLNYFIAKRIVDIQI